MAELRIPIIGEFKGKKAFDDAEKSTGKLDKSVKKLGAAMIAAFSIKKIAQFGKAAASAFIEDQKEATRLTQVVKNLGLAFDAPAIEDYIGNLSRLSGVTDSDLRPAMQSLLQVTGSVTESQKMLTQAIDIAAATGIDLSTVAQDLGRAYTGNTRGLRKYNLGLTQAELTTSSYVDVQTKLEKLFGGTNAAQLGTYAGQMQLLAVAAGEAQETIGQGLIDAMITVTDSQDVTDFISKIDSVATAISKAIGSTSRFALVLKGLFTNASDEEIRAIFDPAQNATDVLTDNITNPTILKQREAERKRIAAEAAKRQKELAALQKKTIDNQKKTIALSKASKTIDLDRIGMTAALRGKISETDRLSLNLQLALLDKNEVQANKLSAELEAAVKRQQTLAALLLATPKAPNPYADWKIPELNMPTFSIPATLIQATTQALGVPSIADIPATNTGGLTDAQSEVFDAITDYIKRFGDPTQDPTVNVTVVLDSGVVAGAVSEVQTNNNLSGSFTTVGGRGANTARFT